MPVQGAGPGEDGEGGRGVVEAHSASLPSQVDPGQSQTLGDDAEPWPPYSMQGCPAAR